MKFNNILEHIREIEIVHMMLEMYQRNKKETPTDPVEVKYAADLEVDPVLKFIDYCEVSGGLVLDIPEEENKTAEEIKKEKINIIRYLAHLFYSIKGTKSILSQLSNTLGENFKYIGETSYTANRLEFKIDGTSLSWVSDEEQFIQYFSDFLNNLIFINKSGKELLNNIDTYGIDFKIEIDDEIRTNVESVIKVYKIIVVNNESRNQ